MRFLPGQSGNPSGRTKGAKGGRLRALEALDKMLAKHTNQVKLVKALEEELDKRPVLFFKTIIMPLLPREARLDVEQTGVVGWRSLVGEVVMAQRGASALPAVAQNSAPCESALPSAKLLESPCN